MCVKIISLYFVVLAVSCASALNLVGDIETVAKLGAISVKSYTSCLNIGPYTNQKIGTFTRNPERYCSACFRDTLCCQPEPPDGILHFELFDNGGRVDNVRWDDESVLGFEHCTGMTYLVHGYLEDQTTSGYLVEMAGVLSRTMCTVMVDWSKGNGINYHMAVANVRTVGAMGYHASSMAKFKPSIKFKLVGFSLGGHIIAEAARFFEHKMGRKIELCHGLDPAGPLFDTCPDDIRINANICQDVQVSHSNAMYSPYLPLFSGLGTAISSGNADFWLNCGRTQHGACLLGNIEINRALDLATGKDDLRPANASLTHSIFNFIVFCDHFRAALVYLTHIKGLCKFDASECKGCPQQCQNSFQERENVPFMNALVDGDYKVETGEKDDYCPHQVLLG